MAKKKPTPSRKSVSREWSRAASPPPALTVSEWADLKRVLPETSGARGARWRTAVTPYLRGIMDAVHEPGVKKIALMKCAQVGGSEALHNILGYFIEHDPCPMLFVHPTAHDAEEWSKDRLADMLRSTPALAAVIRDKRQGRASLDGESTLAFKMFPGGFLAMGGANTPNTFARRSVRIAIGDDVDRFPPVVGEEGDPTDLLVNRTTTFEDDALVIFVSTPTMKRGRIDTLYQRSDQRRYVVTCQSCQREDWISWNDDAHFRVAYEGHDPETARILCAGCRTLFDEVDRRKMVTAGRWAPTATPQETGLIGFQLPAMIATIGVTLPQLVDKWLSARARGKESLRVFINTSLGEGWEDRGARMDPHALSSRKEDYGPGVDVPAAAVFISAGVDVQDNRFEVGVMAWGHAGERWIVDHQAVPGNPKDPETRQKLLVALERKYTHATGALLPIHATCIDSGFLTDEVYEFVLQYQVRRIFATKGIHGRSGEPIVGKPSEKRSGRSARPVRLYPINVDDGKADIMNAISLVTPGPGYLHVPNHLDAVDEEYFAQLCGEHRETIYNHGGVAVAQKWVQDRERNEALDLAVLCLAACRIQNPNIRQMLQVLGASPPPASSIPGQVVPAAPHAPAASGRRIARSNYLGGQ